jgi:predicted MPP superfamily phosphohydrolase
MRLPPELVGLRIGLITDVHRSRWVSADDVSHAVESLMAQRPDLVILGGDYVTWGNRTYVGPSAEALRPLTAPHGVFGIIGNHDDDHDMPAALVKNGVQMLKDARTRLLIKGAPIDLVGVRFWTKRGTDIASVSRGATGTIILLAHDPRRLAEAAALKIPLVLSGHTHGGQVVLPVVGAVAAQKFPVVAGLGRRDETTMFVSRGVGTVYVPVRINCPPEVAVLTLQHEGSVVSV